MTEMQRYLAEEVALDHVDGLITRREALRRLGLLGLGLTAASALIAACSSDTSPRTTPTARTTTPGTASPTAGATVATQAITFAGPSGRRLMGAWAPATQPSGGLLVIHENRGLTDHIRSVAGRFAGNGYSSLAIDLLSEEGGTGRFSDEAEAMAALGRVPESRSVADMRAGVAEIGRRLPGAKLAAIGFCFGGGMTWRLIAAEPQLAAAAPFYGPLPDGADFARSKAAVLGVYAEQDSRVNGTRDAARSALEEARLTHEIVTYPGADHAFFNDTGQRYNAAAARQAYQKVLSWFATHVG
jgi:carboxymethylenebutenolidase